MTLLAVKDLRVSFGAVQAVRGVSFDLAERSSANPEAASPSPRFPSSACCRQRPVSTDTFPMRAATCCTRPSATCARCAGLKCR